MQASSPYFSTSQTAQMLGLSVGTIQRMVESGVLKAYTTQGGHRRILATSIRHYCERQGVPGTQLPLAKGGVCILHDHSMPMALQQALRQMPQVQLVSHPLDLAGLREDFAAFFMDAHVRWLDWPQLHRPEHGAWPARWIVYNSDDLPPEQQQAVARQALLCPSDISLELVTGFLLGIGALVPEPAQPPASTKH